MRRLESDFDAKMGKRATDGRSFNWGANGETVGVLWMVIDEIFQSKVKLCGAKSGQYKKILKTSKHECS